jgi:hypothetical protein
MCGRTKKSEVRIKVVKVAFIPASILLLSWGPRQGRKRYSRCSFGGRLRENDKAKLPVSHIHSSPTK